MIIHYIYYTATWETYNAEEMIIASSNFNETHMKNSLLWINEWWWLIEERFCEEVKTQIQLKKYSCCALRVHADGVFFPVKFCSGLALATN